MLADSVSVLPLLMVKLLRFVVPVPEKVALVATTIILVAFPVNEPLLVKPPFRVNVFPFCKLTLLPALIVIPATVGEVSIDKSLEPLFVIVTISVVKGTLAGTQLLASFQLVLNVPVHTGPAVKVQPVLLPPSVELVANMFVPVLVHQLAVTKVTEDVPALMVATEEPVLDAMVNNCPEAPFNDNVPAKVCVKPAGSVKEAAVATVLVKLLNVFVPVIVWLVPFKTTVPLLCVNVPALLQFPATLKLPDGAVKVAPLLMVKLPPTVKVAGAVVVPEPAMIKLL